MFAKIGKHIAKVAKNISRKELNVFAATDFVDPLQVSSGATSNTDHIEGVEELIWFCRKVLSVYSNLHHWIQFLCGFLGSDSTLEKKIQKEKKKKNLNSMFLNINHVRFDLISSFNSISIFMGYLIPKPSF